MPNNSAKLMPINSESDNAGMRNFDFGSDLLLNLRSRKMVFILIQTARKCTV
jgi:hypothetical protein